MSIHLWERQRGGEINQEIRPEIPRSDGRRVDDKVSAAKDPRAGCDKGGAKLHEHVEEVEEVGDSPEEGDEDAKAHVDLHTGWTANDGEVEVERVEEQGEEGGHKEDVVPLGDELGPRVQDQAPPRDLAPEREGLGEATAETSGGGVEGAVDAIHFPWRERERESCGQQWKMEFFWEFAVKMTANASDGNGAPT